MPNQKRKTSQDQYGFTLIEVMIILLAVILIGVAAWWIDKSHYKKGNGENSQNTSTQQAYSNSRNGITISSPANNSTVSRMFTISGTMPKPNSSINQSVSIIIDNSDNWFLAGVKPTQTADGHYAIPINVTTDNALEDAIPVTGGYTYEYKGLPSGKHTFQVDVNDMGRIDNIAYVVQGPTITLNVQ